MVPGERIELPTNGLQNRCSTAELTRLRAAFYRLAAAISTKTRRPPCHPRQALL
jgi:hypothetical protein